MYIEEIVKPDENVLAALVDSKNDTVYCPIILYTGKHIQSNCSSPLRFIDTEIDTRPYLRWAGFEIE